MPDRALLVEKLTNFRSFVKNSILSEMNLSDDKIKQNITKGLKEYGGSNDIDEADVKKLLGMSNHTIYYEYGY